MGRKYENDSEHMKAFDNFISIHRRKNKSYYFLFTNNTLMVILVGKNKEKERENFNEPHTFTTLL